MKTAAYFLIFSIIQILIMFGPSTLYVQFTVWLCHVDAYNPFYSPLWYMGALLILCSTLAMSGRFSYYWVRQGSRFGL